MNEGVGRIPALRFCAFKAGQIGQEEMKQEVKLFLELGHPRDGAVEVGDLNHVVVVFVSLST